MDQKCEWKGLGNNVVLFPTDTILRRQRDALEGNRSGVIGLDFRDWHGTRGCGGWSVVRRREMVVKVEMKSIRGVVGDT